jgi:hypothetical protein
VISIIHHCARDPMTVLSIYQSAAYIVAALAVRYGQHHSLWMAYIGSALIQAGFAVAHQVALPLP